MRFFEISGLFQQSHDHPNSEGQNWKLYSRNNATIMQKFRQKSTCMAPEPRGLFSGSVVPYTFPECLLYNIKYFNTLLQQTMFQLKLKSCALTSTTSMKFDQKLTRNSNLLSSNLFFPLPKQLWGLVFCRNGSSSFPVVIRYGITNVFIYLDNNISVVFVSYWFIYFNVINSSVQSAILFFMRLQ